MASGSERLRHVSEILKDTKEKLTCSICLRIYEQPVTLSCGHSFCMVCINQWLTSCGNAEPSCSTCKRQVATSILDAHSVNIDLKNLCEDYKNHCKTSLYCTYCKSGRRSVSRCSTCANALCSACIKGFCEESTTGKNHFPEDGGFYPANEEEGQMCPIHQEEEAKFVCMPCRQVLCGTCGLVERRHADVGHCIVTRSDAVAELKSIFHDISERVASLSEDMEEELKWLNSLNENQLSKKNKFVKRASDLKSLFSDMVDTYVADTLMTFEIEDDLDAKRSGLSFLMANLEILRKNNDERPEIKEENVTSQIKKLTKSEQLFDNMTDMHVHFEKQLMSLTLSTIKKQEDILPTQELRLLIRAYLGKISTEQMSCGNQLQSDDEIYFCQRKRGNDCILENTCQGNTKNSLHILKSTIYDLGDDFHNLNNHGVGHYGELIVAVDGSKNRVILINLKTLIVSVLIEYPASWAPHSVAISAERDKMLVAVSIGTGTSGGSIFVYGAYLSELKVGQSPELVSIHMIPDVDPAELSFGTNQLLAYIDHKFSAVVFKSFISEYQCQAFKWNFQLPKLVHFCANTNELAVVYLKKTLISFPFNGTYSPVTNYDTTQCEDITGVTADGGGCIWICDGIKNQLFHFSHRGELIQVLYAEAWFTKPHSISFHNNKLIVMVGSGGSSRLVTFTLN